MRPARVVPALGAIAFAFALPSAAGAHGAVHEQIAVVTRQIALHPTAASLYLKRAELHRFHRDWDAALADFDRCLRLVPGLPIVDFLRGRTLFEAGRPAAARPALDRFISAEPDHGEAFVVRARALAGLGEADAAVRDYTAALERIVEPRPDVYVERARVLAHLEPGRLDEALAGLDEGIRRLGPLIALERPAIDLELAEGRYDAALARVERIAAQADRPEVWLARRGEILRQAGRADEARRAFAAALAAIERSGGRRKRSPATAGLETRLRAALAPAPIVDEERQ